MFWFCAILVICTYPIIFIGSTVLGIFIGILSDANVPSKPNPFVSPAKVYTIYRDTFTKLVISVTDWRKTERSK